MAIDKPMVQAGNMTENSLNDEVKKELAFVELYRELTGASESTARSVFMFTGCRESHNLCLPGECDLNRWQTTPSPDYLSAGEPDQARTWFKIAVPAQAPS